MRPILRMITDRRRYGPAWQAELVAQIGRAARAGVHLVQVRERDLDGGVLLALVRDCVRAVQGTRTRVLVNDRVDVALAAGAHGVHLPGDGLAPRAVRAIAPTPFLIGRSVHRVEDARGAEAAGGLDYLIFGTVFASTSKPEVPPAGVAALKEVAAAVTLPVLAVGGVTVERIGHVRSAGAAGLAAIGLFAELSSFDTVVDAL